MIERERNGGWRGRLIGVGRVTRLSAAAAVMVLGAGVLQASSSRASDTAPPPVQSSPAQQQQQAQQANNLLAVAPAGYKQTLEQQFVQLGGVTARYPADFKQTADISSSLQQAAKDVDTLNAQQLAVLYRVFSKLPVWPTLASRIVAVEKAKTHLRATIARQNALRTRLRARSDLSFSFNPTPPNDCTTDAFSNSIYGLIAAKILAEGATIIADRLIRGTPDSWTVVVLGEGTTLPLSPEREPLEIAVGVLDLVRLAAEGAKELMDACNENTFQMLQQAFRDYVHAYVPLKTVALKVIPVSGGTQFMLTGTEDGQPVPLTLDKVYALTPTLANKETDITASVNLTTIDATNGVYQFSVPYNPSAAGYVLRAASSAQTDPTSSGSGVTHTGIITFTKTG